MARGRFEVVLLRILAIQEAMAECTRLHGAWRHILTNVSRFTTPTAASKGWGNSKT